MKKYTYSLTWIEAYNLASIINNMSGDGSEKKLRYLLIEDIINLWPEYNEEREDHEKPDKNIKREIEIKTTVLRSLANGILNLCMDDKTNGSLFSFALSISKILRIKNWVLKKIDDSKVKDFDDEMDDEVPLVEE